MASRVWLYCSGSVVQKSQTQNGNPTKHNKVAIVIIRNPKRLSPNLNPSRVTIKRTHNRRTWQAGSTQPRMKRSWPCVIGLSLPGQIKYWTTYAWSVRLKDIVYNKVARLPTKELPGSSPDTSTTECIWLHQSREFIRCRSLSPPRCPRIPATTANEAGREERSACGPIVCLCALRELWSMSIGLEIYILYPGFKLEYSIICVII